MTSPAIGMLFGLANTATLHLAKGMQRQGIETLRWWRLPRHRRSGGKAVIYIAGVVLNNLTPVWLVLANRFAAPAYATGMFGMGLVVLLAYSHFVLHEPVAPVNYAGALVIVLGTVVFGLDAARRGQIDVSRFDPIVVGIITTAYVVVAGSAALVVMRTGRRVLIGAAAGVLSGGMASLDPVLKALGQYAGGSAGVFPTADWGWIPFIGSFILGTLAFLSVQFAFLRGADASTMVPIQTSVYLLVPVLVQFAALPGYDPTLLLIAGIAVILVGIALTQIRRSQEPVGPPTPVEIP